MHTIDVVALEYFHASRVEMNKFHSKVTYILYISCMDELMNASSHPKNKAANQQSHVNGNNLTSTIGSMVD